jgi:hypothetical protein
MALQVGVVIIKNRFCQFLAGIFWIIDLPLHELFVETSHFPGDGNYFFPIDQTRAMSPASSRGPKWIKVSEIPAHERVHLAGLPVIETKQQALISAASTGLFAGNRQALKIDKIARCHSRSDSATPDRGPDKRKSMARLAHHITK